MTTRSSLVVVCCGETFTDWPSALGHAEMHRELEALDKRVEAIARAFYRRWMDDDYDEFPWDDENVPSNETEREAREYAEIAVRALDEIDD